MSMAVQAKRIKAVAYLRASDDEQALSPQQQRREIEEYADWQGYEILRWYVDEGLSASQGQEGDELRVEYQRLLMDSNAREWEAVLCWSTNRFTRNRPHEAALGKTILRANGVYLDTVKEGRIDWATFEGMVKDMLFNLLDYKSAVDLGRESLRGRRHTFELGGYPYGSIPYGYKHLYVSGAERREVPRGTKTKNLRGWVHHLAVVEEEAEVVRRIFDLYVNQDKSLAAIADILNRDGVPGPGFPMKRRRGRPIIRTGPSVWTDQSVRRRLATGAYVGLSTIGGQKPPRKYKRTHNQLEREERLGNWPAIVDRDIWDRAQAKRQAKGTGQVYEGRSGDLQGILRCGHCGYVLHKENPRKATDTRGDKYRCGSPAKGRPVECRRWTCYEAEMLPVIARELVKMVDEETVRKLEAGPDAPVKISNAEVLRAHLASLKERIGHAAEAFLDKDLSPTMRKALEAKVGEYEADADETRKRLDALHAAKNPDGTERFLEWWSQALDGLIVLGRNGSVVMAANSFSNPSPSAEKGSLNTREATIVPSPGRPVRVDIDKLCGLLKRLGAEVRVFWRRPTAEERQARRRGRGHGCPGRLPEWVVDHRKLTVTLNDAFSHRRHDMGRSPRNFGLRE
jgi:site-specific DNA recombinase